MKGNKNAGDTGRDLVLHAVYRCTGDIPKDKLQPFLMFIINKLYTYLFISIILQTMGCGVSFLTACTPFHFLHTVGKFGLTILELNEALSMWLYDDYKNVYCTCSAGAGV